MRDRKRRRGPCFAIVAKLGPALLAGLLLCTLNAGQSRADQHNHLVRSVRALGLSAKTFTHGNLTSTSRGGQATVHLLSSHQLPGQVHLLPEMGGVTPKVHIRADTKMTVDYQVDAQGLSSAVLSFTNPVDIQNATSVAKGAISEAKSLLGKTPRVLAGLGRMGLGMAATLGIQKASFEQVTVTRKSDGRYETRLKGSFPMGRELKLPAIELPGIIGSIVAIAQQGTRGEFSFESNGSKISGEIQPEGGQGGLRWMVEPMMTP